MNIEQSFWFDRKEQAYYFEYVATVSGERYSVRRRVSKLEYMQLPPLEYLWESMRKQIVQAIEQRLFKDHRGL